MSTVPMSQSAIPAPGRSRVDGERVLGALSPSRAGDFLSCPLLFRFRTIDRLPEPTSPEALRGTLVHQVLEDIFELPAASRTPDQAHRLLLPAWEQLLETSDQAADLVRAGLDVEPWLETAREILDRWFELEDPTRLEPAEREVYVECLLDSGLLMRGVIDRLDITPDGAIRVVDYKSGAAPAEGFEARALFQLRFYAFVLWRTRGVVPSMLQLVYLGDTQIVRYEPDEADLRATERKVQAIWAAIQEAERTGDFQPSPGRNCDWCPHHALCPVFGGTPPPLPPARGRAPVRPAGPLARLRAWFRRAFRRR
jgi:putative RecB family exonuclease